MPDPQEAVHVLHTVSVMLVQLALLNVPIAQVAVQGPHCVLAALEQLTRRNVPAAHCPHGLHARLVVCVHGIDSYVPAEQMLGAQVAHVRSEVKLPLPMIY